MSLVTREQLKTAVRHKRIEPLYLLFGTEDFLRDKAAQVISNLALGSASLREFNEFSFNLNEVDANTAIAAAEQFPMMAARRVVRVTGLNKIKKHDEEALARYLDRPVDSTTLIFIADHLDKRSTLNKRLLEECVSVEFAPLQDGELIAWAKGFLKELKAEADEQTIRHLIALAGPSVRTLSCELEKVVTAALPSTRVGTALVDELVGRSRVLTNFELVDHLLAGNRAAALATLCRLLDDAAEPVMLLGLLASNFHRLALAKDLMSRGASDQEVFREVGPVYGKRREHFLATVRRIDGKMIAAQISRIAAADLAIKTSQATPRLQLEMLICELAIS